MSQAFIRGHVEGGRLQVRQQSRYFGLLSVFEGRDVLVNVFLAGSPALRKFYYGTVLRVVRQHTGYTKVEAHDEMKRLFLPSELIDDASFAHLSVSEQQEFIEDIRVWAAEGGLRADRAAVEIPFPNEVAGVR